MDKFAVIRIQDIISAALLVQSQRKWSVLVFVTKGKFHLVAVPEFDSGLPWIPSQTKSALPSAFVCPPWMSASSRSSWICLS